MKFWKGFSFFFIYPFTMMVIGFLGGVVFMDFFYPKETYRYDVSDGRVYEKGQGISMDSGDVSGIYEDYDGSGEGSGLTGRESNENAVSHNAAVHSGGQDSEGGSPQNDGYPGSGQTGSGQENLNQEDGTGQDGIEPEGAAGQEDEDAEAFWEVLSMGERLDADTAYVLEETDLRNQSVVETTWKLPEKYIGMNREEFLTAMDTYELAPPLSELERGFVSLEVLSFSREKVVVQMNYDYVQPGSDFFLAVEDNYVVVYLEDKTTVYMNTDILLTELPDEVQQDVINWMYIPDEKSLYNFLESYSS